MKPTYEELEAQCAVMREALEALSAEGADDRYISERGRFNDDGENLLSKALSSNAGRDLLDELEGKTKALEKIAAPGFGLELNDPIEDRANYWERACLTLRDVARAALSRGGR